MNQSMDIPYVVRSFRQLSDTEKKMLDKAEAAMKKAHAPYSNFKVGSAVLLSDGKIVTGNNQENAAYPSGLCAERVALFKVRSETKLDIESILVIARNEAGETADAFSCGSCRQVMMEYATMQGTAIPIMMRDRDGGFVTVEDVRFLLPFAFDSKSLDA